MKKFIKTLCILLSILMASSLFVGCFDKPDPSGNGSDTSSTAISSDEDSGNKDPSIELLLASGGKTDYVIVYPEEVSTETMDALVKLRTKLKSLTGVTFLLRTEDYLSREKSKNAKEILVGNLDRAECEAVLKNNVRGIYDYAVAANGNKLVLTGYEESTVINAVLWLCNQYLANLDSATVKESGLSFSSEYNYAYHYNYPMASRNVWGNEYDSYQIVLAKDASFAEQRFAIRLQRLISVMNGAIIPIVKDTDPATDYELRIGKTSRTASTVDASSYGIYANGNSVELLCGFASGYEYFYHDVTNQLLPKLHSAKGGSGKIMASDLTSKVAEDGNGSIFRQCGDFRVMYHNTMGWESSTLPTKQRNITEAEIILQMNPDVVCLQEYTTLMYNNSPVTASLKDSGYTTVAVPTVSNLQTATPILYRSEKFDLLNSGVLKFDVATGGGDDKFVTWAVLACKENSNQKIGLLSVHLAYQEGSQGDSYRLGQIPKVLEIAQNIQETYHAPVLIGGDMNCTPEQTPYQFYLDSGVTDVQTLATQTDQGASHFGSAVYNSITGIYDAQSLKDKGSYSNGSYDHIFLMGSGLDFAQFDILADSYAMCVSDHCPLILDFSFDKTLVVDDTAVDIFNNAD